MTGGPSLREVFHRFGPSLEGTLPKDQAKTLGAILCCRTAALGGYTITCDGCDRVEVAFCSCRNRHCPSCQAHAQGLWIAAREARVLPVGHFHGVFTLPAELRGLAALNPREVYGAMFEAVAETLHKLSSTRLGGQLGFTLVLHTWTRELQYHPHLHAIVTAGAWDGTRWISAEARFLFPVGAMRKLFRGILRSRLGGLSLTLPSGVASVDALFRSVGRKRWVVYIKAPFGSARHVIRYLGRYTHRVGISNQRLVSVDGDQVTFRTRGDRRVTLPGETFVRRFLQHVLPDGFHKIRHYGLYAGANVGGKLEDARACLPAARAEDPAAPAPEVPPALCQTCPGCGGQRTLTPIPPTRPGAMFAWRGMMAGVLRRWDAGASGSAEEGPPPDTP